MKDKKTYKGMSVRISDDAHKQLSIYVASNQVGTIYDFLSDLIIKKTKPKK